MSESNASTAGERGRFQPGDRVRLRKAEDGLPAGTEGVFYRSDEDGTSLFHPDGHSDPWWFFTDDLELIPPEPPAPDARREQVGGDPERGAHYGRLAEHPWDIVERMGTREEVIGYHKWTAVTYYMRAVEKGGEEDYRKAADHGNKLCAYLRRQQESGKAACGAVRAPGEGEQR